MFYFSILISHVKKSQQLVLIDTGSCQPGHSECQPADSASLGGWKTTYSDCQSKSVLRDGFKSASPPLIFAELVCAPFFFFFFCRDRAPDCVWAPWRRHFSSLKCLHPPPLKIPGFAPGPHNKITKLSPIRTVLAENIQVEFWNKRMSRWSEYGACCLRTFWNQIVITFISYAHQALLVIRTIWKLSKSPTWFSQLWYPALRTRHQRNYYESKKTLTSELIEILSVQATGK